MRSTRCDVHKCRFARPIWPDNNPAFTITNGPGDAVKESGAVASDGHRVHCQYLAHDDDPSELR